MLSFVSNGIILLWIFALVCSEYKNNTFSWRNILPSLWMFYSLCRCRYNQLYNVIITVLNIGVRFCYLYVPRSKKSTPINLKKCYFSHLVCSKQRYHNLSNKYLVTFCLCKYVRCYNKIKKYYVSVFDIYTYYVK